MSESMRGMKYDKSNMINVILSTVCGLWYGAGTLASILSLLALQPIVEAWYLYSPPLLTTDTSSRSPSSPSVLDVYVAPGLYLYQLRK
jgi:hypothetical protein